MAVTNPTDVSSSIPKKYAMRVMRKVIADTFFTTLTSKQGGGGAIISKNQVLNKPGEEITIQVTSPLSGSGVEGDTATLEGNEEKLSTSSITVKTVYYRHGVRNNTRAEKKSLVGLREEAVNRLAEWGRDKLDTVRFGAALNKGFYYDAGGTEGEETSGGTPYVRYVGGGTSKADVEAADVMTLAELSKTKYIMLSRLAKPWNIGGNPYFMMVLEPWQEYNIKVTDTVWAQAQREAQLRGGSNPLFTGAVGIWDGIIIRQAARVPVVTDAGGSSNVRAATGMMFGPEAFIEAYGTYPDWDEDDFDYGLEHGVAWGVDYGCRRGFEIQSTQVMASAVAQT